MTTTTAGSQRRLQHDTDDGHRGCCCRCSSSGCCVAVEFVVVFRIFLRKLGGKFLGVSPRIARAVAFVRTLFRQFQGLEKMVHFALWVECRL